MRNLIRPDHALDLLDSLPHKQRLRVCEEQVHRWSVVAHEHPTHRSQDAHAFWLETLAMEEGDPHIADVVMDVVGSHRKLTPRQARRIVR